VGRLQPVSHILLHESIHSRQWAQYFYWGIFALLYGLSAFESQKVYGNIWQGNSFEQGAGLYWGSYYKHPRYSTARSMYC